MAVRSSCLCGGLRWESDGPLSLMHHCHCGRCRKAHGVGFATFVASPAEGFRRTGAELARGFESTPGFAREFCGRCGSCVPGEPQGPLAFSPAGCLDADPGIRPESHIFVAHKAPWHEIQGDLARFDDYPPGVDAPVQGDLAHTEGSLPGEIVRGSCLCGETAYQIEGSLELLIHCHCSRCRKARAAAHNANLFCAPDAFRWLRGKGLLERWRVPRSDFVHTFCGRCGSPMPRTGESFTAIPAGSVDGDPGARSSFHIFTGSKAPWFELPEDGRPRFEEGPPAADR